MGEVRGKYKPKKENIDKLIAYLKKEQKKQNIVTYINKENELG